MDNKEKLEEAKRLYKTANADQRYVLESLFPELMESEDERIRKELIAHFKTNSVSESWSGLNVKKVIAWLEKQGEQKPANKIEPKFHEGEWVVTDKNNVVQIKAIKDSKYVLENTMRFSVDYVDKCWRKWDISDANDGDVLVCESGWTCIFKTLVNDETFSSYCFMDKTKWFCETGSECHTLEEEYNGKIHPTTKEQRDTLMKAMADAGYTFDFEKKELKKIEQNPIKVSKQEWNEETSMMIDNILGTYKTLEDMLDLTTSQDRDILESMNFERDWIKSLKYRIQQKQEWGDDDEENLTRIIVAHRSMEPRLLQWIKNFKYRVQPKQKWSEEDERNLNDAILFIETGTYSLDKDNLINWLKSLRPQNRCGWNDMSVKPIYPCDILYQQPNGNMFIYRYIEGGRANDAQTPTFCNLDENGKWIYLKDIKPQNTWKPSDEQMKALRRMKDVIAGEGVIYEPLNSLYKDLKKL